MNEGQTTEQTSTERCLTQTDIDRHIVAMQCFTAAHGVLGRYKNCGLHDDSPLHRVSICTLVLEDRSVVVGVSKAEEAGFNADTNEWLARENAIQQVRSRLAAAIESIT